MVLSPGEVLLWIGGTLGTCLGIFFFLWNRQLKREIASRKRAEKKLIYSENLFRKVFSILPVGLWLADKNGKLIKGNPEAGRIWGKLPLVDVAEFDIFKSRRLGSSVNMAVKDRPLYRTITEGITIAGELLEIDAFDGEKRVVSTFTAPVKDDAGNIQGAIEVNLDLTRIKAMESQLIDSKSRYRALFEHNPIQTIIVDKNARIMMHNFAGKKRHGSLPAVGDVMYKDYAEKHSVDMYNALMACMRKNEQKDFSEIKYKERYLNISIAPFSHGAIITLIDVTDRCRLMEELQQARKMEAIGTLAGGVAHDFNNLLGIILGNMELALDEVPQWSSARENLKEIQTAGLRARDVVHQLLSFSRKCDISKKTVDLRKIVKEAEHLLRASIPTTIEIKTEMPKEICPIKADSTQIQQIIINLSTNGAHAMEAKGTGILTLGLENVVLDSMESQRWGDISLTPGKYVVLRVSDTGHGIDSAIQEKLFDPYFTTKEVGKGSGMGLFVVHGIVKSHDATLQIESQPERGTTIKVFFPATDEMPEQSSSVCAQLPRGEETILVVDDEISLVKIASVILGNLGYQVKGVTSSREALALFQSDPMAIDLVITDMTMPEMNGKMLAKALIEIRPEIPIILCTGIAQEISVEQLKQMGIAHCIEKPLERSELATAVRRVLDEMIHIRQ
ncbi:PAS domain-containing hybrid sensor histidine kinase/response regulator [Desulfocicer vacuolatum]|uniref:PAS domain-containing hybrid sensor histidine kinase/response regulator n=1 Tax=Desulfocicer vacuolatum TaxID=2298 RepID=UPI001BB074D7|nr:response regulator [Desulfocicer vacuolatum]